MAEALMPKVDWFGRWTAVAEATGNASRVARAYLSDYHLAHRNEGCAAAALATEIGRHDEAIRAAFANGAEAAAETLGRLFPGAAP